MLASQKHKCRVSLENEGRHWSVNCETCEDTYGWLWTGAKSFTAWELAIKTAILHAKYHWIR